MVYPTLTFLEEAGYVTAESEGAKKRYTITDEGRAYLEENRDIADMVLARLAAIGKKLARMRRKWESESDEEESVPQLVDCRARQSARGRGQAARSERGCRG